MSSKWTIWDQIGLNLLNLQTEIEFSKPVRFIENLFAPSCADDYDDNSNQSSKESGSDVHYNARAAATPTACSNEYAEVIDGREIAGNNPYNLQDIDWVMSHGHRRTPKATRKVRAEEDYESSETNAIVPYDSSDNSDFDEIIDNSVEAFRDHLIDFINKFIETVKNISSTLADGNEDLENDMVNAWKELLKKALCGENVSNCASYKLLQSCGVTEHMFTQLLGVNSDAKPISKSVNAPELSGKKPPVKLAAKETDTDSSGKKESPRHFSDFRSYDEGDED